MTFNLDPWNNIIFFLSFSLVLPPTPHVFNLGPKLTKIRVFPDFVNIVSHRMLIVILQWLPFSFNLKIKDMGEKG